MSVSTFGFIAHVLDDVTLRVAFETSVDDSALSPGAYSILPVTGIPEIFVPTITGVQFYDSDTPSVSLNLSGPLTLTAIYSLQLSNIQSLDGRISISSTYNFTATVPSPPRAVGAFLSDKSCLDIVFDKSVRDTSVATVAAQIVPVASDGSYLTPENLILNTIATDIPETNLRFSIQPSAFSGYSFVIQYQDVVDSSYNSGSGEIALDVRITTNPPWSYTDLSTPSITTTYIDKIIPAENRTCINMFFSCPITSSSLLDISNWVINKEGVHVTGDSLPVTASDPTDEASLLVICNDLKSKFNGHLSYPGVHYSTADSPPSETAVIVLLNDLLMKYNSHAVLTPSHSYPDRDHTVNLKPAFTVKQAVELALALKTNYNAHLNGSHNFIPYHIAPDTENVMISPDPSGPLDLEAASIIADEFRTRLLMHELGPWHPYVDSLNYPSTPYSRRECIFPSISTGQEAISFLNELQLKYVSHILSKPVHLYQDDLHNYSFQNVTNLSEALISATKLKEIFNGHIVFEFPVEITSIAPFSEPNSASYVVDGFTYTVCLEVVSSSVTPRYYGSVNAEAMDSSLWNLSFQTHPFGYTEVLSLLPNLNFLSLRTSSGLSFPRPEDMSITNSDGKSIVIKEVSLSSSVQFLRNFVEEMMRVFRIHLDESGISSSGQEVVVHLSTDTQDNFSDSYLPVMTESSIVASLNFFKSVFNSHVRDVENQYHVFQASANSVDTPDATDFNSAIELALSLNEALLSHRSNLSSHYGQGPRLQFSKVFDTLNIFYDGLLDNDDYTLKAEIKIDPIDPYSFSSSVQKRIMVQFSGVSNPPYLSAATPLPGAGRGAPKDRLASDRLDVFFSKPMREEHITSSHITISGPPGLVVGDSYWQNSRVLRIQVHGMDDGAVYSLDANLLADLFGNPIQSYPIPPP